MLALCQDLDHCDKASRSLHGMSGEAAISQVASALGHVPNTLHNFKRGHHTSGSNLFETIYFSSFSRSEELASKEPSPLAQIPKVS